jgi:UDP-N-acetylglucosamine--N-acetylmuramyl-(pentapeptide) pyrophosphoryl-undecaprenol N-acetylglucosamine transferase
VPTILIMAGGTGGHVMPGLAVAAEMQLRHWDVVWLGSPTGMEAELVAQRGIKLEPVSMAAARGKSLRQWVMLPFRLTRSLWQSMQALRRVRPAVVLGMGGYVAFPGGVMARLLNRPLVIHEQNSIAGLTNKILARIASTVMVAFPDALKRAVWAGNPVRAELIELAAPAERFKDRTGPLEILVVGGSLGAQALNSTVPRALALLPRSERPSVTHQSGKAHLESLSKEYRHAGVEANLVAFIDDMASEYARADLVICRAGAMTVSELAAAGAASVLVPFPFAVDDHQTSNAKYLSEQGAGVLIDQPSFTPDRLATLLRTLDRPALLVMAEKARKLSKPLATQAVADACVAIARQN